MLKRSAIAALSVGVVAGLTLGAAPAANADGHNDIVFIQGVKGDGFYITMDCGVKAAAKKAKVKVKTVGPAKFDATLQRLSNLRKGLFCWFRPHCDQSIQNAVQCDDNLGHPCNRARYFV